MLIRHKSTFWHSLGHWLTSRMQLQVSSSVPTHQSISVHFRKMNETVQLAKLFITFTFALTAFIFIIPAMTNQQKQVQSNDCQVKDIRFDWDIDKLSTTELFDYFNWSNSSSCGLVNFFGGYVTGGNGDSGLDGQMGVCLDKKVSPNPRSCLVYSFGINRDDWSFGDSITRYRCQVFNFEARLNATNHTRARMVGVDDEYVHFNHTIEFFRMGIDDKNHDQTINETTVPFRTLETIYHSLKTWHSDATIDYLRLSIEGDEWRVIPQIIKSGMLDRVRQLGVEINLNDSDTIVELKMRASVLQSLENHGMVRFTSVYNQFTKNRFNRIHPLHRGPTVYVLGFYNSKFENPLADFLSVS